MGHNIPQLSEAHTVWLVVETELEIVVAHPVTEHPVVAIVVKGEQVVVETTALPMVIVLGTHTMLVCNAVSKLHEDDEEAEGCGVADDDAEREFDWLTDVWDALVWDGVAVSLSFASCN
ncbi:Hypothetical protein PENO1_104150 [Penicillium occitanis (nom. inval.)]|nr:Hypothetical protein PENO1_104150 [Penicillium occitanis (nom. inval.)]